MADSGSRPSTYSAGELEARDAHCAGGDIKYLVTPAAVDGELIGAGTRDRQIMRDVRQGARQRDRARRGNLDRVA